MKNQTDWDKYILTPYTKDVFRQSMGDAANIDVFFWSTDNYDSFEHAASEGATYNGGIDAQVYNYTNLMDALEMVRAALTCADSTLLNAMRCRIYVEGPKGALCFDGGMYLGQSCSYGATQHTPPTEQPFNIRKMIEEHFEHPEFLYRCADKRGTEYGYFGVTSIEDPRVIVQKYDAGHHLEYEIGIVPRHFEAWAKENV